ncbi:hypothetical protein B4U79_07070 [Dinothrombium tinctorium]|uniref:Uncharacterized protein n=1 Tax=Dinothrombium tinctorium TaxID=1965070 RepID=A0A443REQ1_9ACAR|nr:hypothetical protein B4U79_07070 [Dinothrombium tinctorium]
MSENLEKVDLNSLRLRYNAEFDDWQEFVLAVDEFQRATNIKLTITTSKKFSANERAKKRAKGLVIAVVDEEETKDRFEYKYLKLTCKHYGGYRSTSRGIRPNQKTVKLMCPTYIYGAFDHYKDKFCIKQMVVNCNHELKDEEVLLPKLLKDSTSAASNTEDNTQKKYVRKRNRNVLKVPLEAPVSGMVVVSVKSKVKCNHEASSICEAYSLTTYDLSSIISQFSLKSKEEQNELIMQWIEILPYRKDENVNDEDKVQVQFRLPTIDDTLIKVCSKSFLSILGINMNRVDSVISTHYSGKISITQEQNSIKGNQEVEASIATILTSLSREEPASQVLYIDHADLPSAEDTIEDPFIVTSHSVTSATNTPMTSITIQDTNSLVKSGENPFYLGSIPWSRQENDPWTNNTDQTTVYYKINSRNVAVVSVICRSNNFQIKIYNQPVNCEKLLILKNLQRQYAMKQVPNHKLLLDRLNSLTLCCGLKDSKLKALLDTLKDSNFSTELFYCFYSDSYRSKKCDLLIGDDWSLSACRECSAIADILRLK